MWALSFISIYDDGFTFFACCWFAGGGLPVCHNKTRHTPHRRYAIWQSGNPNGN